MLVTVRKAKQSDIQAIVPARVLTSSNIIQLSAQLDGGDSYTCECEEGIIYITGMVNMWNRVNHGWLLAGDLVKKYPKSFHKISKKVFAKLKEDSDRLQITVSTANDTDYRWARRLGFEVESIMQKYGPDGEDQYMMVVI